MSSTDAYEEITSLLNKLNIKYEESGEETIEITYQIPKIGRCEFCNHWKHGRCTISRFNDLMRSGCGLYTKKNFGCVLFKND